MNKEQAIQEFKELFPDHTENDLIFFEQGYEMAKSQMIMTILKNE